MERETITLSWSTVRFLAAGIAALCLAAMAAVVLLAPQLAPNPAPMAAPQAVPQQIEERALEPMHTTVAPSFTAPVLATAPSVSGQAHSPLSTPTTAPLPSATPTATSTLPPTETPIPTHTPLPTNTPLPTPTPAPTNTPLPTNTPAPTNTPTPILPLTMEWVTTEINCISSAQWAVRFWLTASGGTGEYTFYHDIKRLHGPHPANGFGYKLTVGTGAAAVGTLAVESGTQRVESEFWIARPDCGH